MTENRRTQLNLLIIGPGGAGVSTLTRCLSGEDGGLFSTEERNYVAIDVSADICRIVRQVMQGSVVADGVVLVSDVSNRQSEHFECMARLVSHVGVDKVVVALNKVDLLDASAELDEARERVRQLTVSAGLNCLAFVPVSAMTNENVHDSGVGVFGVEGPSLTDALDAFEAILPLSDQPLRLLLNSFSNKQGSRFYEGRMRSGVLVEGDQIVLSPSNTLARVARVQIVDGEQYAQIAHSGDRVSLLLDADQELKAGELLSHVEDAPIETDVFRGKVWWCRKEPLTEGSKVRLDIGGRVVDVEVQSIDQVIDLSDVSTVKSKLLSEDEIGEVVIRAQSLLALDTHATCPANARLRFLDGEEISGFGLIRMDGYGDQRNVVTVRATNVTRVAHQVSAESRIQRHEHRGAVLWFTGLSGAGKSTLAVEVERALFERGYEAYVLDGDNIRHGLNADLGFSPEDRSENIRRVGEVAALFARAGIVAISAFISPYRSDRARARVAAGNNFHEIYIKASVEVCERRDPKGLYARARSGELKEFTGVSAPYEAPEGPDLVVDTSANDIASCVAQVVGYADSELSILGKTAKLF